ncbi:hypothetical protein LTR85_000670 [Meristemomyces frigidus]|nr:hypothetical protein LTR85_000670 [Meristemomyces frigidus]
MDKPSPIHTPVVIVGGGPVGLCLALFLNYYDIECTIINTGTEARMHPKGNGQNARTMEHYRQLGISDEIRKLGLPSDHPFDQAFFTRFCSHEIYRYPAPSWNERKNMRKTTPVTDQFPEPMFHVNQMYVEKYLFERVRECENVDVRFGWEANGFSQDDEGVSLTARKVDGAEEVTWRASYVVDCSGGRSSIRRSLGIEYAGDVQTKNAMWAGKFYTVWLRIPELYSKYVGDKRAWMYWAVNPDPDTRSVLIALNGRDEFELLIKPRNASEGVNPEEIKTWIRQSIGADLEVDVLSYVPWTAGAALTVEQYQAGRVLLAGDAAHLFTPVGAFGMNTGVDDVHNLAWKLAAVLEGWGGPKLVDSYELERRPVGSRNTGAARKYSSKWHDPEIPNNIEADTPEGEAARKKAPGISYIVNNHFNKPEELDCAGVQLGARYNDSPLIVPDGEPPMESFPETYNKYCPSGVPGGRAPHIWLDDKREIGSSLYDRLGKGFTLLRLDPTAGVDGLVKAAKARSMPMEVLDVELPEAREMYERSLVLIRPDKYIAWRGDELPVDLAALLALISGS